MKLRTVQVTDYKSIRDSNPFSVGDITCLVGKNESGKTALLEALYRLNPIVDGTGKFDVTDDFPRSDVEDYRQDIEAGTRKPAVAIRATFELEDADVAEIQEKYGPHALTERTITVSKGYENENFYIGVPVNESAMVQHLAMAVNLEYAADKSVTLNDLQTHLALASAAKAEAHSTATKTAEVITDPQERAKAVDAANELSETEAAIDAPMLVKWQQAFDRSTGEHALDTLYRLCPRRAEQGAQ